MLYKNTLWNELNYLIVIHYQKHYKSDLNPSDDLGKKRKKIPFDNVYYFPFDQLAFNQRVHKLWQPIIGRILIEL